jgi:aminopeptidase N
VSVPDDLWASLSAHVQTGVLPVDVSFKTVMDTWLTMAGYPVVTLTRNYDEQKTATFSQVNNL